MFDTLISAATYSLVEDTISADFQKLFSHMLQIIFLIEKFK